MHTIKLSIRNLVEFILRTGDLQASSGGFRDPDAMQEGTRIHKKLQRRMGSSYHAEVPLRITLPLSYDEIEFELTLEGRADGIYTDKTGEVIDEIKGVYQNIHRMTAPVPVHRAQALCYAYIYAKENELAEIAIRMTYCHIPTEEVRYFNEAFSFADLEQEFFSLVNAYAKWAAWQIQWQEKRNLSCQNLDFPFPYRDGQLTLVKSVYQSILRKKRLYIEAPTGVGKTISTVFPTVKAVGEGFVEKIFYLTAKTITRTVAEETFSLLTEKGMEMKCVTITAKEKICILPKPQCNTEHCDYAKGHYDRINDAVYDLLINENHITRDVISEYAKKHSVCPFELSLDTATWCDAVIGDYNYAFDPTASLKRFFAVEKQNDFVFLIDEAHNLVDRAREMYSASLIKEDFLEMKKLVKQYSRKLVNALENCNKALLSLKRECDDLKKYDLLETETLVLRLMRLTGVIEEFLQNDDNPGEDKNIHAFQPPMPPEDRERLLNFYFQIREFQNIYELADDHYLAYGDYTPDYAFCLHLKCMDPAQNLDTYLNKCRCSVFFSATLLPIHYYKEQLASREDDYAIYAPSPFSVENRLLLLANDVSTKYTRRGPSMYRRIADYILSFVQARVGNYLIFFPSYKMLEDIREYLLENDSVRNADFSTSVSEDSKTNTEHTIDTTNTDEKITTEDAYDKKPDILLHSQSSSMTEEERELFLSHFQDTKKDTTLGLCVMGGIFSEGIDLTADRLIGAVIVGTGLPMVCTENELYREYFEQKKHNGFSYAYQYPGMNKVLQAAGRVIRTAEDTGAILLLDERFLQTGYQALFPKEWFPHEVISLETMSEKLRSFWETH